MWIEGLITALSWTNLLWLGIGTVIGLIVGVLPALGPNFGVALMLPFTFGMDPATAIIFLVAIHAACNYGDSVTSIMVNIPGGPGTVATCWDGYPLAQQGKAGTALGIATFSSFIGGAGTWLFFALTVDPIKKFAFAVGAPEYFALGLMALGLISVASPKDTLKGLIMALFGLALSTVGQDEATGLTYRFGYGVTYLQGGIPLVVSTLGIFAISQVILMVEEGGIVSKIPEVKDSFLSGLSYVIKRPLTLLRAGAVGWFVGILPALGVSVAGIAAYFVEKKYSKESSEFGKGAPGGLVAAEVGKGACVVGDLIPTFTLGVPGSVTGAILMGALIIQGIEPGPRFLMAGKLPYTIFVGMVLAQGSFLLSGLVFGKFFTQIVRCPNTILAPIITVLTFLGAYADRNNETDIILALVFGVFAYILEKLKYPVVCMVLGLILGPLVEANFHRSLGISFGSYSIFLTRPITVVMLSVTTIFLLGPYLWQFIRKHRRKINPIEGITVSELSPQEVVWGEPILLAGLAFVLSAFMITGQGYEMKVRLFPSLVGAAGLIFILWRFLIIVRDISFSGFGRMFHGGSLFNGRLGWQWSVLVMIVYILLMFILGFIVGSAVYVVGVILLCGHRKWTIPALCGILTGAGIYIFIRIVRLEVPLGIFEFLR